MKICIMPILILSEKTAIHDLLKDADEFIKYFFLH